MSAESTTQTTELTSWIDGNLSNVTNVSAPDGCITLQLRPFEFNPWDNPDNLMSHEVEHLFDVIVAVGFLYVLFLVSAPTNVISMIAFYKQGIKERINLCLFLQSFADLVYMTFNFLLYSDRLYLEIRNGPSRSFMTAMMLNNYLACLYSFSWASGFMTVVIASERCFCVVSPFRSQRILRTRTMGLIIVAAFVVIFGGFFVVGARWTIACIFSPLTQSTSYEIYPRQWYLQHKQIIDTLDGVYGLILPCTFVFVVTVTTTATVVKITKMTSWREKTSSANVAAREIALTRMLIGTSSLYVVCSVSHVVTRILILCLPDFSIGGRYSNTFNFMSSVNELFTYINSSVNFFIYYSMGSKYKETVRRMFGRSSEHNDISVISRSTIIRKTGTDCLSNQMP
ncbi:hypothetical protein BaRGS_00013443 [Batillaria attramentaria]|uniref:G-protein coupled receptors family 1 profile domain-containing protein n=1 Tax=Batillaria attramentaria TaxID=370345 RepID=A0ABD0L7P1_9CAEN